MEVIFMKDKVQLEKEHSEMMNREAVERIKREAEELERSEAAIFEDDAPIKLRNGKTYYIPPLTLKNARTLMKKLRTINVDAIILNFLPTGNEELDKQREDDLFEVLQMAFVNYPEVDRDFIDQYMDLETAREVIDILIGLNRIKK
jgi:hypothetical protein